MNQILLQISSLPRRDQWAILIGSCALILFLLWVLLLAPLQKRITQLNTNNLALEQSLGRVQMLVQQIQSVSQPSSSSSPIAGEGISAIADASLREAGMIMTNFQPGVNGEARVRVDKASADGVMQWMYDLERKHHILIREISITALNEPGQVSINTRLVKP